MTTDNTTEEPKQKPKKLVLTCWEDSEPYEPGTRNLFEFEDDKAGILNRTAAAKAIDYVHDLLNAVTDYRFDLHHELSKLAVDICKVANGKVKISFYEVPISIVNLLIQKYNIELEEA